MSQKSNVILGALAVTATIGAVQLAFGHDLADRYQALSEPRGATEINRTAKGDREPVARSTASPARTVMMKVDSLADTSVVIRIPIEKHARSQQPAQPVIKAPARSGGKRIVACEPVVSVLTEVAKLLQPGKCVT
jgi:hypothetical protein